MAHDPCRKASAVGWDSIRAAKLVEEFNVEVYVLFASTGFYDLANKLSTRIESNTKKARTLPDESLDFAADETGKTRLMLGFTRLTLVPTRIGKRRFYLSVEDI